MLRIELYLVSAETSPLIIPLRLATFQRSRDSKIGLGIDPFLSIQRRAIRLLKSLSSSSSFLLRFLLIGATRCDPFSPNRTVRDHNAPGRGGSGQRPEWSPPPPVESSLSAFAVQYTAREIFGVESQRQICGRGMKGAGGEEGFGTFSTVATREGVTEREMRMRYRKTWLRL